MVEQVRKTSPRRIGLLVLLALGTVLTLVVLRLQHTLPSGPEPVAWDRETCAQCHMHIGDPHFAAQLQTSDGQVFNFDDPGCLLRYIHERRPRIHAVYFHHYREDRWIPRTAVAFVPVSASPMGYGLGAVDQGIAGAMSYQEADHRVLERIRQETVR